MQIDENTISKCIITLSNQEIGAGGNAIVFKAVNTENQAFAAKVPKNLNQNSKAALLKEKKIHSQLDHKNITRNLGLINLKKEAEDCECMLMEYCNEGDLHSYISKHGKIPEQYARSYFKDLIQAIHHLHSKGVTHEDIKPENILLDNEFTLKLNDFGSAYAPQIRSENYSVYNGTKKFWPPELLDPFNVLYERETKDIYASGMVLFFMVAGFYPFESSQMKDHDYKLFVDNTKKFWRECTKKLGRTRFFSESFKNLIQGLLCPKATGRLTLDKVLAHPWLSDGEFKKNKLEKKPHLKEFMEDHKNKNIDISLIPSNENNESVCDLYLVGSKRSSCIALSNEYYV